MEHTGHRSVNGVHAYKRGSEKLSQLTSSVLNRNEKKAKVEEGMKTAENENVQPAELVKPKGSCIQSLSTMPLNYCGASQFTIQIHRVISLHGVTNIPVNCDYPAASYCMYAS